MKIPPPARSPRFGKAEKLALASTLVCGGFVAAVAIHYWMAAYEGLHYPHSTFLGRPADTLFNDNMATRRHCFGDLLAVCVHAEHLDPYFTTLPELVDRPRSFPSNYFPFGAMIAYPLTWISYPAAVAVFSAVVLGAVIALLCVFCRTGSPLATAQVVVPLALMNYPLQMTLDRGNIEGLLFAFLALAVCMFVRHRPQPSAMALGAAIAMKALPLAFVPIWCRVGGWRAGAIVLGSAALLTITALALMPHDPLTSLLRLGDVLVNYSASSTEGVTAASRCSGLYAPLALASLLSSGFAPWDFLARSLAAAYPVFALAMLAAFLVACLLPAAKLWELFTLGTVCMVGLPQCSPDYRLIHLLLPFVLFVNSSTRRPVGIAATTLFSLLFIPKNWPVIAHEATVGAIINPVCLAALFGVTWWEAARRDWHRRRRLNPHREAAR